MKRLFIPVLLLLATTAFSQDTGKDPYAIFGHQSVTKYETSADELLYIKNWDTTSPVKAMIFDMESKEVLLLGVNDNVIDRKDIKPEQLLQFLSSDPMSKKYPGSSPYNFTDNNPIARLDPDGDDWIITSSPVVDGKRTVHIKFIGAVYDGSFKGKRDKKSNFSSETIDCFTQAAASQIKEAYTHTFKEKSQAMKDTKGVAASAPDAGDVEVNVEIEVELRMITKRSDLSKTEHLIEIVPEKKLGSNTLGQASFGGKYVRINENTVSKVIDGSDAKTVPHELGHTARLAHPNSDSQRGFLGLFKGNQYLKIGEQDGNLMYQTGYQKYALQDKSKGNMMTLNQVNIMQAKYDAKKMNRDNLPKP